MKSANHALNESMEDFITNLQSKVSSLQNQYISFVSYCSDLILSHVKNMRTDLIPERFTRETPKKLLSRLESFDKSYKSATKGFGFNISIKSVQVGLTLSQQNILSTLKQDLNERELEKTISSIFAGLSEIIYRDQYRAARKSGISESKSTRHVSSETQHKKAPKISDVISRNHQTYKNVPQLEIQLVEPLDRLQITQKLSSTKTSTVNPVFANARQKYAPHESVQLGSITGSPSYSPILGDSLKKTSGKITSTADKAFNMGRLKYKLENIANLLEKFAVFAANIETAIHNNPELQGNMNRFNYARRELAIALKDMIAPAGTPTRSLEVESEQNSSNEVISIRSELSKVQQELIQRNEEIIEINSQLKTHTDENRTFRSKISDMKQEINKFENDNEELRLEIIYSKSQIERHQKNNKILQESLAMQEKKLRDVLVLQAKYGEIIIDKGKSTVPLGICVYPEIYIENYSKNNNGSEVPGMTRNMYCSNEKTIEFQCYICANSCWNQNLSNKKPIKYENQSIEFTILPKASKTNQIENNRSEDYMSMHKNMSILILEKNKLEEEIIAKKDALITLQEENKGLLEKLVDAIEMCKILEDLLSTARTYRENSRNLQLCIAAPTDLKILPQRKLLTVSKVHNIRIPQLKSFQKEERLALQHRITSLEADLSSSKIESQHLSEELKILRVSSERSLVKFSQHIDIFFESISILISKPSEKLFTLNKKLLILKSLNTERQISREPGLVNNQKHGMSEDFIKKISISLDAANSEISELKLENNKLIQERKKLLETRDRLISQCNAQSEELLTQKLDTDEKYSEKIEDLDYQIALLQGQVKKLQANEATLNKSLLENAEKYSVMCLAVDEKSKKIEELQSEISELRFRHSVTFTHSGENLKEEIFTLKMKNIRLEQQIQESKLSQSSPEEISNLKKNYISQISHIDEERKQLERKLKDTENNLNVEKQLVSKTQDNYAKRLAGANLEINTLKQQIFDLNQKIYPTFYSYDEFNVVKDVNWGDRTWHLIEIKSTKDYIWLDILPELSTE